jgi:hypothetical protein
MTVEASEVFEVTAIGAAGWPTSHFTDAASAEAIGRAVADDREIVRIAVCHRRTGAVKSYELIRADLVHRIDVVGDGERCVFLNPRATNNELRVYGRWPVQMALGESW